RAAGPRLGKDVQTVIKAVKSGDYEVVDGVVVAGGIALEEGEYTRRLVAENAESTAEVDGVDGLVVLDMTVTEELEARGWAADRIRGLQDARKASGLDITDRISVTMNVPAARAEWSARRRDLIAGVVLAISFEAVVDDDALTHDLGDGCTADVAKA